MDPENAKEFEQLITTFDPVYRNLLRAIEIVKEFIIDNNLIIYGGSAIDYALRLKGAKIYPDDLIPDLDFYSPNNVPDSYKLADILYNAGFKEARSINALHMETMRVDAETNHFVADITYRPAEIFADLPFLEYNKMRIIHPDFQRLDLHSSLSFPYDNSPREVIFDRWRKDITRFNKLNEYYPIAPRANLIPLRDVTIPDNTRKYVFTGFAAYAILYTKFIEALVNTDIVADQSIIKAKLELREESITFSTLEQKFQIVHFDIEKAARELGFRAPKTYEPYINIIPQRIECDSLGGDSLGGNSANNAPESIVIYSTKNKLLSVNGTRISERKFRIVNIQYLMHFFLSNFFIYKVKTPRVADTYLAIYLSLAQMIAQFEKSILARGLDSEESRRLATESLFFPSIKTYGAENINLTKEVALNRLNAEIYKTEQFKTPINYNCERAIKSGRGHPAFNPAEVTFFNESGKLIEREIKKL